MIRRRLLALIRRRLRDYPAVALTGPRQSGKTTLARAIKGRYFDLEQASERLRLDLEWESLVDDGALVVLDEAQTWPEIFSRLRGAIDRERRRNGRFLLLGSVSPSLMSNVSESLAGRLSLVELTPFLATEIRGRRSLEDLWLRGGFPDGGILKPGRFPQWQKDYLALLTQRDLPAWGLAARPQVTERMFRMLTAVHGQVWNASRIGQSLGLSYHTVNGYMDYLEGAFLIRRLPPYLASVRKRLVKSPKFYWRDSGLLHALCNVSDRSSLLAQPWVGASWEGFVIEQALGAMSSAGRTFEAFYFRTSDQHEIDLVLEVGRELWAIEVKLTASPGPADMNRLDTAADLIGATRRCLVSSTPRVVGDTARASCNLPWLLDRLR